MCALQRLFEMLHAITPGGKFLVTIYSVCALSVVQLFVWGAFPPAVQAEVLKSFQSDIRIRSDASFSVRETIVYDLQDSPPHGIYRVFPLKNQSVDGSTQYEVKVVSVKDEDGNPVPYSDVRLGDVLSVRLGRPKQVSKEASGSVTYILEYEVWHAFRFLSGWTELRWNATGNQWPFTIENAIVNVWYPEGATRDKRDSRESRDTVPIGVEGYVQSSDSSRNGTVLLGQNAVTISASDITAGDAFYLLLRLPEGVVKRESLISRLDLWWSDWWLAVLMPLLCATALGIVWWLSGRDDSLTPAEDASAAERDLAPPKGITPAELGTIIDEQCDIEDVFSTVIDLAVRGCLKIRETDRSGQVDKRDSGALRDYEFVRLNSILIEPAPLSPHETRLLDLLFSGETGVEREDGGGENGAGKALKSEGACVKLSELKQRFFGKLTPVSDSIYQNLTAGGYFKGNPNQIRASFSVLGASLGFLGITLSVVFSQFIALSIGLILCGLITFSVAGSMPARTAAGARARRAALDLKRRLQTASPEEVSALIKANPESFEKLLPYALVLGVVDEWAQKSLGLLPKPPYWFEAKGANSNSSTLNFDPSDTGCTSNAQLTPEEHLASLGRALRSISCVFRAQHRSTTRLKEVAQALGKHR